MTPMNRQNSISSTFAGNLNKKITVVPTETLDGLDDVCSKPHIPPLDNLKLGDDIGRDLAVKAEMAYAKETGAATSVSEAEANRKEWEEDRLNIHGGPTVLPPRAEM